MGRAPFLLVLVLAALMGSVTAASAKCVPGADGCPEVTLARATVTGPGLGAPIVIDDDDFWGLARQAGLDTYRPSGPVRAPGEEPLGPRYRLHFIVRISDGRTFEAIRYGYPYAVNTIVEGVPVSWTTSDGTQTFIQTHEGVFVGEPFPVEPGWYRSASLYRTLVANGLPQSSPVPVEAAAAGADDAAAADDAGSTVSSAWLVIALLAGLGVLLVGGAITGRPRSRPSLP